MTTIPIRKVALVTGSTSGIGKAIAEALAQDGCDVMLHGFGDQKEISLQSERLQTTYNIKTSYSDADISNPLEIEKLITDTQEALGNIDILVNNAGIQHVDLVEDFPPEKWNAIIAINLSASYHTTRLSIASMKARGYGRIINIASAHGLVASAKKTAYVAAKHGIVGLTKAIALETAGTGVTCNALCPGWVLTPLVQKQIDAIAANEKITEEEARIKLLSEKQPSKTFITPEQLGAFTVFLTGSAAAGITGSALSMDGGWVAQ
jgi:3-hydroxybutyrate dehydrogenase